MTKSEQEMAEVIDILLANGFVPNGETKQEIVRIPTTKCPVFGKSGGELVKLGGRLRFCKSGTNIKVTVGKRTTSIYLVVDGVTSGMTSIDTSEIDAVKATLVAKAV